MLSDRLLAILFTSSFSNKSIFFSYSNTVSKTFRKKRIEYRAVIMLKYRNFEKSNHVFVVFNNISFGLKLFEKKENKKKYIL